MYWMNESVACVDMVELVKMGIFVYEIHSQVKYYSPKLQRTSKKVQKTHKRHNTIAFLFLKKNLTGAELFIYFDLM